MSPKDLPWQADYRFCNRPGGGIDFGVIHPKVGSALQLPAWPIRLQVGAAGPNGFGKAHIESTPGRPGKLSSLGFPTVERFVEKVAQNYHRVCDAGDFPNKISIVFKHLEHDLALVLWQNANGFWSVTTGLPYRIHRRPVLWERTQADGSESPP